MIYVSLSSESEDEDVRQFTAKKLVAKKHTKCQALRALAKLKRSPTWTARRDVLKEHSANMKNAEEAKDLSSKAEYQRKVMQVEEAWAWQLRALMHPELMNTCNLRD